ncbi:MAG: right-handed parallel beta-helix repeat-containing protein [Fuerstiella sp.]|nr:right-handed parallel beta-helix repeat-containing protein [Gammaproteobacteria bacterium]MCP4782626.1 right-handed parallel beta-helix repeat-containing protein [Fuerstiella sp.]
MPASSRKSIDIVDITEAGCVAGSGHATANTTILRLLAAAGKSLFVPEGSYEVESHDVNYILYEDVDEVVIMGESAKSELVCVSDNDDSSPRNKVIAFHGCNGVEVKDMTFTGWNIMNGSISEADDSGVNDTFLSFMYDNQRISVHNCTFRGIPFAPLMFEGASVGTSVTDNLFYLNETDFAGGGIVHDIWFRWTKPSAFPPDTPGGSYDRNQAVIVSGNRCLSNGSNSILFTGTPNNVNVSDNICVPHSYDFGTGTLTAIEDPDNIRKKHAITLHYNITNGAPDPADRIEGAMVIADNVCVGGRFCGIYANNNNTSSPAYENGGVRGTITGNYVSLCGNGAAGADSDKQGGIIVEAFNSVTIVGNTVENIQHVPNGTLSAGISLNCFMDPNNNRHPTSVVSSNTISRVDGIGIKIKDQVKNVFMHGNTVSNCTQYHVYANNNGQIVLQDNQFFADSQDLDYLISSEMIRIDTSVAEATIKGNRFDASLLVTNGTTIPHGKVIRFIQTEITTVNISDNQFFALDRTSGGGPDNRAIVFLSTVLNGSLGRMSQTIINNNTFHDLYRIIDVFSGATAPTTNGPVVMMNNLVTAGSSGAAQLFDSTHPFFYPGRAIGYGVISGQNVTLCEIECTGAPDGTFAAGDRYVDLATGDRFRYNGTAWVAI